MILALMVTKNEAERYLESSLNHIINMVDGIVVYDDRSTDDTAKIASQFGKVVVRSKDSPSFLTDESKFREAAWDCLNGVASLGDGIISLDADEFYIGDVNFESQLDYCKSNDIHSLTYKCLEVFSCVGNKPMVRVDGFWNDIWVKRFGVYQGPGEWAKKGMASGSLPSYCSGKTVWPDTSLLHMGYATAEDRQKKYDRYMSTKHNHNSNHIASIISKPKLEYIKDWTEKKL